MARNRGLELDSLDALQISMAIQKKYGVRMPDSKDSATGGEELKVQAKRPNEIGDGWRRHSFRR